MHTFKKVEKGLCKGKINMQIVCKADRTLMKIMLQNKFTPPKISVMQYICGDILYGILSAEMKS